MIERIVQVGGILVDVVMVVPALPEPGGDVLATDSLIATGGGFNVLSAARRQGLGAAYLGPHGTGEFGDRIRTSLDREGIETLLPRVLDGDSGFCIGLVDASGERTYATRYGVEGRMTHDDLAAYMPTPADVVYLSGYELGYEHGPLLAAWFAALPEGVLAVFDPGPIVGEVPDGLLLPVLTRADWVSLNVREARILTGASTATEAAEAWAARFGPPAGGLVVRDGADGCLVRIAGESMRVHAVPVDRPVDTSGAGDTHVGAFVAALARGEQPSRAAAWANAAAAWCVTRFGPANGPTLAQLRESGTAPSGD